MQFLINYLTFLHRILLHILYELIKFLDSFSKLHVKIYENFNFII